jgi:hemoglobin
LRHAFGASCGSAAWRRACRVEAFGGACAGLAFGGHRMEEGPIDMEAAIEACVEDFHMRAFGDPLLCRLFLGVVPNIPEHLRTVCDFWSHALLETGRYPGSPFPAHLNLSLGPEHFERWIFLFREAALRTLPQDVAAAAIAKAEQTLAAWLDAKAYG